MSGIYLHIPFCRQACHYCDFHFAVSMKNKEAVIGAMKEEIRLQKDYLGGEVVRTIYLGGGTPSVLSPGELNSLLDEIDRNFKLSLSEITLEANPDDLDTSRLKSFMEAGVNRLSIGVQSFHNKDLKSLNRSHDRSSALRSIENSREAGFTNINMDLIYGLPSSSLSEWEENLNLFGSLGLPHLSAYSLTYEDRTAFGSWLKKGVIHALDEELVIDEFRMLMSFMKDLGYEHYEISNFAKAGMHSVHNSSYWKGQKYLGIGPSAHSYNTVSRKWNVSNNSLYVKAIRSGQDFFEEEILSERDRFNEFLLTSLRTSAGLDLNQLDEAFGAERRKNLESELAGLIRAGLLEQNDGNFILSEKGKLVADKITSDLFEV